MVGHKFVEELVGRAPAGAFRITVLGAEPRSAYDRVALSTLFSGATPDDLSLGESGCYEQWGVDLHLSTTVDAVDLDAKIVRTLCGKHVPYDTLVLGTGSRPFVPPMPGHDLVGCFVYRTIEDLDAIRAYAQGRHVGVVVGGGLLGLEAANALLSLGLETHVLEMAPRLMPLQIDVEGGEILKDRIGALGVKVHLGVQTKAIAASAPEGAHSTEGAPSTDDAPSTDGAAAAVVFADDSRLPVDLVVFSAGIRPDDALARSCGPTIGERGGIVVDDGCSTSDPHVFAVGECAVAAGRVWGLVAPGYDMARVVVDRLLGGTTGFTESDLSTKLKLMGVDVASFGDAFATTEGARVLRYDDPLNGTYRALVVDISGKWLLGGILVGDASGYATLSAMAKGDLATPDDLAEMLFPARAGGASANEGAGLAGLSNVATVCRCNNITKGAICTAISEMGFTDLKDVKKATKAGTSCGGCTPLVQGLLNLQLAKDGVAVRNELCEHFAFSRPELFDIVRVQRITSFADLIERAGTGFGCEICKPAVASMFASMATGHILDGEHAGLQDTNDHFLANLQRDGSYSVVPRVPGGEITPSQLITIGEVAQDFGLYTKITGGQRIDLFGARVDQLPTIWSRLIDAGMESGHAYGKALRTVKSCVGDSWCRYGVQDSTSLAIDIELRYRGLRAPHKIKSAVSGCARECAEAQSKDFGIIATERGWNLYVCGNGGMRPQHAVLLAEDLETTALLQLVDRFLMFYIRTAGRLERTATWLNNLEGGIDYLRRVVIDDALGICSELEAEMDRHVATYECEWKATVESPERMVRFRSFVNADSVDPTIVFISERGQPRPARNDERSLLVGAGR